MSDEKGQKVKDGVQKGVSIVGKAALAKRIILAFLTAGFVCMFTGCFSLIDALSSDSEPGFPDPKTAEDYYQRAMSEGKWENWQYRGWSYLNAIDDFGKAIELDPVMAKAYFQRGISYQHPAHRDHLELYDYNDAISDFRKCLELDPLFSGSANANIGRCYYELDDYENARLYSNKVLEIDNSPDIAIEYARDTITWIDEAEAEAARKAAQEEADRYDPANFIVVASDFRPSQYEKADLFDAVAASEKLDVVSIWGVDFPTPSEEFVSDVVFVSQNGTDITFRTDDNAISQRMKVDSRTALSSGQKVRVYYTAYRLKAWQVIAIEKL